VGRFFKININQILFLFHNTVPDSCVMNDMLFLLHVVLFKHKMIEDYIIICNDFFEPAYLSIVPLSSAACLAVCVYLCVCLCMRAYMIQMSIYFLSFLLLCLRVSYVIINLITFHYYNIA